MQSMTYQQLYIILDFPISHENDTAEKYFFITNHHVWNLNKDPTEKSVTLKEIWN